MKKIGFLFGSGISLKSGFPSMNQITDKILTGENIGRHTDLNYYFDYQQDYMKYYVDNNVSCLNYVKDGIVKYYKDLNLDHTPNYEDLYYVLSQINDSEGLEFENPALKPYIDDLKNQFKDFFHNDFPTFKFKNLLMECLRYIHCVVWHSLSMSPSTIEQLNVFNEINRNKDIDGISIFSLNHDLLIEEYCKISEMSFTDGFHVNSKAIPELNFDLLKGNEFKIKLFKLHGSIDWYNIQDKKQYSNIYKVPMNINVDRVYKIDESLQYSDGLPIFLIGTFNKLLNYISFIWEELYQCSQKEMSLCENIIISGYSFNDKGININLIKWLNSPSSKRIIIIHPNFENLSKNARGAYHIHFDPPQPSPFNNAKLRKIEKKFEDVTYDDLFRLINE